MVAVVEMPPSTPEGGRRFGGGGKEDEKEALKMACVSDGVAVVGTG